MSDERPQYGEYATPEEQRLRAGLPPVDETPAAAVTPPVAPVAPPVANVASAPVADATRPRPFDRAITFGLLTFGLINVFSSMAGFFDLGGTLNQTLKVMGLEGEFTNFDSARMWGPIAAIVLVIGYGLTVWRSVRRVKANQAAWWVPLVGFVLTTIVVSICIAVPMFGDPAFIQGLGTPAG